MDNRFNDQEFYAPPEPEASSSPGVGAALGVAGVLAALGGLAAAALSGGDKPASRPMGAGPRRVRRKRDCRCGR